MREIVESCICTQNINRTQPWLHRASSCRALRTPPAPRPAAMSHRPLRRRTRVHARLRSPGGLSPLPPCRRPSAPHRPHRRGHGRRHGPAEGDPRARTASPCPCRAPEAPGYTVDVATDELALTTERSGKTVLGTAGGDTGGLRFRSDGSGSTPPRSPTGRGRTASSTLTADTTLDGATVEARLTPAPTATSWTGTSRAAAPTNWASPTTCRRPATGTATARRRPRRAVPVSTSPGRSTPARSNTRPSARPRTT